MWRRTINAVTAFGVTVVAYQVYALVATPLLEPPAPVAAAGAATEEDWSAGAGAVDRYQRLLAGYFPADHWSLRQAPKVVQSGQVMLVLEDYRRSDDGRVALGKFAVLIFPTRLPGDGPPPRDAVIIEAPGGATLQFDDGFNPARGKIGRPVRGVFPGELVIRSDMEEPGPEDDLRLVTRDLRLEQTLLLTDAETTFRLGPHHGRGRRLEIRLIRETTPGAGGAGIAGVSSLELREGFEATLRVPGAASADADARAGDDLRLTSAGPFRFDFTRFVASLQHDVRATIDIPGAPSDQLFCSELLLHLSSDPTAPTTLRPADEPELARRQGRVLGRLQPYQLEALGDPVRLDSPRRQASARGRRMRLWVADRRLRIEGVERAPATLAYGLNETHAAWIDYRPAPADAPSALGDLSMAGPGWLRVATRKNDPTRLLEARWRAVDGQGTEAVRLARDRLGQPLLLVAGRPEVAASGLGRLEADRLSVRLREVAPDGPDGPALELAAGDSDKLAVRVERVDAAGDVRFRGRELEGSTQNLVAWFRAMPAEERSPRRGSRRPDGGGETAASRLYRLTAGEVQLEVGQFGRKTEPTGLLCTDDVRFEEVAAVAAAQPVRVEGQELRVDGLHREHVRLTVAGAKTGRGPDGVRKVAQRTGEADERPGFARITAKGMRLWVRDLNLDQAAGRVWTDSAVDARMRLDAKLGRALQAGGGEATLRARGGMVFDGRSITLRDDVFAETASGWIHAEELEARLATPIDLRAGDAPSEVIDVAEVECRGGVSIDQRLSDAEGQTSHQRARMKTLRYNRLTGGVAGEGPGWVRSVSLAGEGDSLARLGGGEAAAARLRFLRVHFQRGLSGNLNDRALRFHERVRGVYGPVLAWDQELPVDPPTGPPPDAVTLACDELRVHADPAAPSGDTGGFGPMELRALGTVRFEGESRENGGSFVAEAAAASYTQLKEVFVLEGAATRDATIWVRDQPGRAPARTVARKITYHRPTGRVKAEDIRGFDYQATGAPFGAPPRR